MDCLFCNIAAGEIPAKTIYEDDLVMAFYDIAPAAPVHILVIPKPHIPSAAALTEKDAALVGHIFAVIARLAREHGFEEGFRIVSNVGALAGQSVPHLHFHLLSGRALAWPPG
ncbi:MAG: histidine triad nucleotide-binding protein [Oscillospiraceae bacterium]|jgi:histidine triad (HIT) family protein|nr:histidine triad nucleotide-binding protein [Oscillospiraceae bacterium]